jgi:hypothetical protein
MLILNAGMWVPVYSQAADAKSEGFTPAAFEIDMSSGLLGFSKSSSQFDIGVGLQVRSLWNWLQWSAEMDYQKISFRGGSTSNTLYLLGPTVNLDSYIFSLGLAIKSGNTDLPDASTSDPSGTGFYFIVGRHIVLSPGWSLRPTFGVVSAGTSGIVFRPFAIAYSF